MARDPFEQGLAEVRADRSRGASELARRALGILADCARDLPAADGKALGAELSARAQRLCAERPSMAPVHNLLSRWCQALEAQPTEDLRAARELAADAAARLQQASREALIQVARQVARMLGPGQTLMTHSSSSTVIESCRLLSQTGLRMVVTESRPLCEGQRLARRLSCWSVPTLFITDAQMGLFLPQVDAVLVGADSVLGDGAVVNKAGTALLALAARDLGVPFYVCCESFKYRADDAQAIELEEMNAGELGFVAPPHVTLRNIYFDVTPARLVSAWVTEVGVIRRWGLHPMT